VGFWVRDDSLVCFAKAREGRFLVLQGRWRWEWWLRFGWYKKSGLGFCFFRGCPKIFSLKLFYLNFLHLMHIAGCSLI